MNLTRQAYLKRCNNRSFTYYLHNKIFLCTALIINLKQQYHHFVSIFFQCNGIRQYSPIYITIHSPNNHLCALDTTLRILITFYKLHVILVIKIGCHKRDSNHRSQMIGIILKRSSDLSHHDWIHFCK